MSGKETLEISSKIIENQDLNSNTEKDDLVEISILGIFDDFSIVNLENEFQDFYSNLQENEINWRGFTVSFYKPSKKNKFEVNFKTKCRFEQIGEIRAQALDHIHELGGIMGDIESTASVSL